jgi:hypothetical protein
MQRTIQGELKADSEGPGNRLGDRQRRRQQPEQSKMPRVLDHDATL